MANRTVKDAKSIHGTNPQYLIEKIIRTRIYDSKYWKEECFALTAELLVDKGMALRYIGGIYGGNVKPTPFLCLILKMLQIQPEKDIVVEFIKQDDWKYVRALGAFYLRLVYPSLDCFKYLEPLLNDYRKLRVMNRNGQFELSHMDEYIDGLLREERISDVMLPRIQKRWVHENANELEPRVSLLMDDLDDLGSDSGEDEFPPSPPLTPLRKGERDERNGREDRHRHDRSPHRERRPERERHKDRDKRHRSRSKERGRDYESDRKRRRSRSRDRRHRSPGYEERKRERREKERDRRHKDRDHKHGDREHRDKGRGRDKEKKRHRRDKDKEHRSRNHEDDDSDIAEANELRARLGLPPLRM